MSGWMSRRGPALTVSKWYSIARKNKKQTPVRSPKLLQLRHHFVQNLLWRTNARLRQSSQWLINQIQHSQKILALRINIKQAGHDLACIVGIGERPKGFAPVRRIIIRGQFLEQDVRAVVQDDVLGGARVVVDGNVFKERHETHIFNRLVMVLDVAITFSGTFVIIKGNTRRDNIKHRSTSMSDGALEEGQQLLLVAGKRPPHVSGAEHDGQGASINGREIVHHACLEF